MFRRLTMPFFRLYMKYLVSSYFMYNLKMTIVSAETCSCTLGSKY